MSRTTTRVEFARWVHDVLSRLYDSPYLQSHPLAEALAGPGVSMHNRSQNLRRIILAAIRGLRPEGTGAAQAHDRRASRILALRFVEGLSPADAMQQLAYGRSQFFHEQARMIELLTVECWNLYQELHPQSEDLPASVTEASSREQIARSEVERLLAHATWENVDVAHVVGELQSVLAPLAQAKGVTLALELDHALEVARGDRVLLRQVVLNAVAYACTTATNGHVAVRAFASQHARGLMVEATAPTAPAEPERAGIGLELCRQLMLAMHGTFTVAPTTELWRAELAWQIATPQTLLVVDDNQGFVELFRRYLNGHSWHVVGAATTDAARSLLRETPPAVIILDVMMPKEDGWEFLIGLRANPATRDIPVIVSSVLNEPQMAQALGANGYLLKPVNQQALLLALAPWWKDAASQVIAR